jgi:uncharacterized protein (DUF924 family)
MSNSPLLASKVILDFWFSPDMQPLWFVKNNDLDETIRQRFGKAYEDVTIQYTDGRIPEFKTGEEALAFVIVLDQFSRNMFRNSPKAFEMDETALKIAKMAVEKGLDRELTTAAHHNFLYMPFMHSESLEDQEEGIRLFYLIPGNENTINYARQHKDIIATFKRFPHRNDVLQRESTPDEQAFLKEFGGF